MINEGKAHVDGYEIELPHSIRVSFDQGPNIKSVESEPHTFQPNSQGVMELKVNDFPIKKYIAKYDFQKNILDIRGFHTPDDYRVELRSGLYSGLTSIDFKLNEFNSDDLYKLLKIKYEKTLDKASR